MKAILIFGLLATLSTVSYSSELKEIVEACLNENDVSEDEFNKIKSGDFDPKNTKDNQKCAIHCFMTKASIIDESGKINAAFMKSKLTQEAQKKFDNAYQVCDDINGESPCETSFLKYACLYEHQV